MTIDCVFDTSALCAYHLGEPGREFVGDFIKHRIKIMHFVNVAEFCFSITKRQPTRLSPKQALMLLALDGISSIDMLDDAIAALTAEIRLAAPALSIGDGFAIALASVCDAPVVTADRAFLQAADFARIELVR